MYLLLLCPLFECFPTVLGILTYLVLTASKHPTPAAQSPSESESESDIYGGARNRGVSKKQRRRLLQSAAGLAPTHAEVRFSTRKAAKVSNYNEDDGDMFSEDETDMLTTNYWATGADENVPAIDAVLNHRLKDDISKWRTIESGHRILIFIYRQIKAGSRPR